MHRTWHTDESRRPVFGFLINFFGLNIAIYCFNFKEEWPEGMSLAAKMNFKFTRFVKTDLHKIIPNASADGIALIESMLAWDPKKRITAMQVLN